MLIACLQIKRPEDLKSLCLTSKSLRAIATPPLYREILLPVGGHKDIRVSGLLSQTNPGVQHIRKLYLHLEKVPCQDLDFQTNSDDSSEDDVEVKHEDIAGATRQAQFTVRLLLDFLPNDILENFKWVPIRFVQCHRNAFYRKAIALLDWLWLSPFLLTFIKLIVYTVGKTGSLSQWIIGYY